MTQDQAIAIWTNIILACLASALLGGDIIITAITAEQRHIPMEVVFSAIGALCIGVVIFSLKQVMKTIKEIK